jgi:hypothetical protein
MLHQLIAVSVVEALPAVANRCLPLEVRLSSLTAVVPGCSHPLLVGRCPATPFSLHTSVVERFGYSRSATGLGVGWSPS